VSRGGNLGGFPPRADRGRLEGTADRRVPFDAGVDFEERTRCILHWYRDAPEPYRRVMVLLLDCASVDHGHAYARQYQGATYRQIAAIAHAADMSREVRRGWYAVCESVGLADRHARHILGRLRRREAA
jgi:hypothetical protein